METLPAENHPNRRRFMRSLAAASAGVLALLGPLVASMAVIFDPLKRKASHSGGFVKVGHLSSLPANGMPRKFDILADQTDAWNKYPNVPVGSVYLRRTQDNTITAFNVICPHAGCFVQMDRGGKHFNCPCHDSQFGLDGDIANPGSPSPRGLDTLKVEIRNEDEIWVQYQRFKTGVKERIPLA